MHVTGDDLSKPNCV